MPYLDHETIAMQNLRKAIFNKLTAPEREVPNLEGLPTGAKLLLSCFWEKLPVHDRRTLDQFSYYTTPIKKIWEKDQDQVLWRYMEDEEVSADERRILMVDQLWMWIIDSPQTTFDGKKTGPSTSRSSYGLLYICPAHKKLETTVLTAFAPRWHPPVAEELNPVGVEARLEVEHSNDVTDVYNKVWKAVFGRYQANILTVTDLVCLVIDKCAGMFHPLPEEGDDNIDYLDVFAVAIGNLVSRK
jgi:hypothetical protein